MSENDNKEQNGEQSADQTHIFETVGGRKFDLSSAEGRAGLKAFQDALSFAAGRASNEVGTLRKELAPFKKLGMNVETTDEAALATKVKGFVDEGQLDKAFEFMFSELQATRKKSEIASQEEKFWNGFVKSHSDLFEAFDEDVAKTYVFANYREAIWESEDPYSLVNSILEPKVSKFKQSTKSIVEKPVEVPAALEAGRTKPQVSSKSRSDEAADEEKRRQAYAKSMGIK